jgi:2-polyprenyl-6-methoxyphenol hydroxylase-like FAD-dependent oxidoreductase
VSEPPQVLVAGAGPAGLALALQAHHHGAAVRVIDRRPEAVRPSRALILHARTLEVLRPLGVTQALLARADIVPTADLLLGSRLVRVTLADLALPDTAFPHLSLIRQMDVEQVLAQALADRGIEVERGTELAEVRDGPEGVRAIVRSPAGAEEILAGFVAGCDGPASTVRAQAGIGWPGGPYPVEVVLADAELDGDLADDAARVVVGRRGLLFVFRLGEQATWRLLATRPAGADQPPPGQPGPPVPAAELQALMEEAGLGARISELAWSSRIRLQHRVAARFCRGRLFLAGDAAHAYSPATGQGMNAAIQDAANLGWKLAFAAARPGSGPLLDSYDRERRPVARQVLAMSHLVFWAEAATGPVPSALRGSVAPLAAPLVPVLAGRRRLVAEVVRLVSQLRVSYRRSPLSVEGTPRRRGGPRAGDRLPDQLVSSAGRSSRLHELLARPGVHILLDRHAALPGTVRPSRFLGIHRLASVPGRGLIAVRPDGYIGFRCATAEVGQLEAWLTRLSVPPADRLTPRCGTPPPGSGVPHRTCRCPPRRRRLAAPARGGRRRAARTTDWGGRPRVVPRPAAGEAAGPPIGAATSSPGPAGA